MAGAAQHAIGHGAQRENVAGPHEGIGMGRGVCEQAQGVGAVGGGNAGGDALGGIHAHGEGGFLALVVAACHLRQVELLGARCGQRRTDQPAAVDGHEIDHFRGAQ